MLFIVSVSRPGFSRAIAQRRVTQGFKFRARQLPTGSATYAFEPQRAEGHAPQRRHVRTDGGEHAPHLPVSTLAQGHFVVDPVAVAPQFVQRLGVQRLAIVQNAVAEALRRIFRQRHRGAHFVDLGDAVARVCHGQCQRAVVGYQQQPFAVAVQTADGIKPTAIPRQIVQNRAPPLGIVTGAKHVVRLVEQQVDHPFRSQRTAVEGHCVAAWIERHAHFSDDFPVDGYASGGDPTFAGTARARSALRHPDVQTQLIRAWFWGVQRHASPRPICRAW